MPNTYAPPANFAARANLTGDPWAVEDAAAFWEDQARRVSWAREWDTVHTWQPTRTSDASDASNASNASDAFDPTALRPPVATWFAGGTLNVAVNCVDRHVDAGLGDRVAFHFEGERGDTRTLTYSQLQRDVAQAAHALEALGIGKGDRVVVYLPVIPETVIITLAIARIGAIHSLVFGGFSAEALRFRVEDTGAKLLVTSDGQFRRGSAVAVKANADAAVAGLAHVEHVLVVRRTGDATPDIPFTPGRDVWWHDIMDRQPTSHEAQAFDAETPLFIIYTSGTTGKPKGIVHTSGGYLTQASWTHWALFDAKPDDVYWCTADLAWVTAHTYVLYGPLSNGATSLIYEGTPDTPHRGRHFELIEKYGVTTYYTAPTLVRTLASWFPDGPGNPDGPGDEGGPGDRWDLSSIRLLGTVGEAINPAAWEWLHEHIGGGDAPIVDTWWQSETGAAVIAPLPGISALRPGSAGRPLPAMRARVVDEHGDDVPRGVDGLLVLEGTWPSMARTVWRNPQRYLDSYWAPFADRGYFLTGDGARIDADGFFWLLGRIDDVINVSGHRLSTIEIESALVAHPSVSEAAAAGVSDARTGDAIVAFVTLASGIAASDELTDELTDERTDERTVERTLRDHVAQVIGPIAKPREIYVVGDLPKTRSGKIMRRLLRDIVEDRALGDTTSLQDESVPERIATVVRRRR